MRVRTFGQATVAATATAIAPTPSTNDVYPTEAVFSMPESEPAVAGLSGGYDVPYAKTYTEIRIIAATAGTGPTTLTLLNNGVSTGASATLAASATESVTAISVAFLAHDNMSIQVTAAGSGATGLVVTVR